MLAQTRGKERIDVYLQVDKLRAESERDEYRLLLKERLNNKTLQYIIGEVDFMGIRLNVDKTVLIPRPETEQLIEKALERLKSQNGKACKILDVGTGSGNMAIALAKFLPAAIITAIDVSAEIIAIAKANAVKNEVAERIEFYVHNIKSD